MVAPTHQQQHQQQQPQSAVATTAEDEALKRETDCVYFLASPLTCKKGSECEYRHSEYARVNPRDCYYWLNGKCLNPKCPYRHPPLDGLFGAEDATPSGPAFPLLHSTAAPAVNTPYNSGKPVPCLFFSKGLCLKGDRCAFLHGPNPSSNKALQPMALAPGSGSMPVKKAVGGLQKCSQEQKITAANFPKTVESAPVAKPAKKADTAPPRNGLDFERKAPQPKRMSVDIARNKTTNVPPIVNGNSHANRLHQSQVVDDHVFQNGKDGDDFLRESSPGFDVLVDDELRETDYYHDEDQYGRTRGPEERNLNSVEEYGMGRSTDYNSMVDVDQEAYHDRRGYDSYDPRQGQYGSWEQRRALPERMVVEPGHRDRRGHSKADSGKHISETDLRYRLSKHRSNGLKSVVSHDFAPESRVEERGYQGLSRRDSRHSPSHESSISSRLRGRIKLPGRSADNDSDVHAERGDRARNWGRLSPGRSQISSQEGRLRNRIKDRLEEDHSEGKKFSGPQMNREIIDQGSYGFAAPRRLAELKVVKNAEGRVQQSLGKRKYIDDQPSEASLSFDGPMPLSEILKRKRETGGAASGGGISSNKKDDSSHKASRESFVDSSHNKAVADTRSELSSVIKGEAEGQLYKDNEQRSKSSTASAIAEVENTEGSAPGQSSGLPNADLETEEGMIVEEGMEEPEYEGDYQEGDEEYEYEEGEEGDYTYEEGENVDPEEDYVEEEDGNNDYASNVDAVLS